MSISAEEKKLSTYFDLHTTAEFIRSCQDVDGAIYWFEGHKLDPWDHTEAAMALSISGDLANAKRAYQWLLDNQNSDGSWYASYEKEHAKPTTDHWKIETNFVAYPATGLWHFYLIFQDQEFLKVFFPMLKRAIDYVVDKQGEEGEIQWALSAKEELPKDALITACSSVLRSLECAIKIAEVLNEESMAWKASYKKLRQALLNKPWRFDRTWESKSRYSMDWFYPILAGAYSQEESKVRLEKYWHKFVEEDLGCRCVADQPWVTVAESCELVMALLAAGEREKALALFKCLTQWRDKSGGYWTGYNYRDKVIWPEEKTSWTAGAVVLAADALFKLSPAASLFTQRAQVNCK